MSTSAEYANIVAKKLFGYTDFGDKFLNHVRDLVHGSMEKVWNAGAVYDSALAMAGDGNDKFEIVGTSLATDGKGHILDIANATENDGLQFENATGVDYYVAMKYNEIPSGVRINPRTGWPEYIGWIEEIGESDEPDAVTDNGNGTITFQVDSVTEPGVTNAGRRVLVYKVDPAHEAITSAIAIETCTVVWTSSQNRITTTAALGQTTISTTASDYRVVLLGPTVKRNTDLRYTLPYTYIGYITGNGPGVEPSSFNYDAQDVSSFSFSKLSHITRIATNGRMKIDVKPIAGETNENQIQSRNTSGGIVFSVDELGNVVIEGDLTVQGETTQNDVVIVNSSETITDNLTAGDDDAVDSHTIKGTWWHTNNAESANYFVVRGSDGMIGMGQSPGSTQLEITGGLLVNTGVSMSKSGFQSIGIGVNPYYSYYRSGQPIDAGAFWRTIVDNGHWKLQHSTSGTGDFSTSWTWIEADPDPGTGFLYFNRHTLPSSNGTWSLGSSSRNWYEIYGQIFYLEGSFGYGVHSDLNPAWNNYHNLGNSTYRWQNLYVDKIYSEYFEPLGGYTSFKGDLIPNADGIYDLGSSSYNWDDLYVRKIHLSDSAGLGFYSNVVPAAADTFNLGTSAADRWNQIWGEILIGNRLSLNSGSGSGVVGDFEPSSNAAYYLGASSYRWLGIYLRYMNVDSGAGQGVSSNLVPSVDDTHSLGNDTYRWHTIFAERLNIDYSAGHGSVNNLYPAADAVYELGSTSYRWFSLYSRYLNLADDAGYGVISNLNPTATSTYNLGSSTRRWQFLYAGTVNTISLASDYMTLSSGAGEGIATDFVPTTTLTRNLGNSSYYWSNLYVGSIYCNSTINFSALNGGSCSLDTLFLDGGATDGVTSSVFKPQSDNASAMGTSSYKWASVYTYKLYADTGAGNGVGTSLNPLSDKASSLGTATYGWDNVYCDDLYYDTASQAYDDQDDLGLVEEYGPTDKPEYRMINKGGIVRRVQAGNRLNIPWPMLGPVKPGTDRSFISVGGSVMFLLGAMKQLYQRYECEKAALTQRIERLEEQLNFS